MPGHADDQQATLSGHRSQDDASEQSGQDEYEHARTGAHAKRGIRVQFKSDPACLR